MQIATNLLSHDTYYCKEVESQYLYVLNTAEYMIERGVYIVLLKRTRKKVEDIEEGFHYCYYSINDKLYLALLTHRISKTFFNQKQHSQLGLDL